MHPLLKRFFPSQRRMTSALPLALVALLLLAACAPAGAPAGAPGPESAAPAADAPAGQPQGVMRLGVQPIVQSDPALISSDSEVLVANLAYDYLVDIDGENNIVPRLATEWNTSEDGLTWTFQLAEGVTFHDGAPLTAADVVWTFDRLRDPDSGFPTSTLYQNISSIEATGELEVIFTLAQTNPFFLYDLSDNHALVMKAETETPTDFNGTGAFRVVEFSPEDRLVLEANPDYFVEGQPGLAGIEIIFFNDQTASFDALRGGQVDLAWSMPTALFVTLEDEPGLVPLLVPTNGFDVIRFRSDRPPGNDPRVVQALKLATDREALFQLVAQGYGAVGRDSPIGPLYTQYYTEETPIPARDPEAARALLAEAGYPDGLDLVLHVPDTGNRPALAAAVQNQWEEAGFNVELSVEPQSIYYGEDGWLEVDFGITGWGSRPYPQFYLDVMLVSDAQWNESRYANPEFDRLVEIAGTTLDEEERVAAYHEIQRILIEEGPIIIPYFGPQLAAISDRVQGFELRPFAGRSEFRNVTLTR
jgi:peptide/nickel transport system substrate-binding protein